MLRLTTFGNLTIERDGRPVTSLASRKAEALLVYLAANPRPHSRELLADLLWDDRTQKQAQANLRVILSSLRKEVGEFVDITRETAGVRPEAKLWLDVAQLEATLQQRLSAAAVAEYEEAVALYRGEFLEGFFVREASGFEAWQVRERERLHRLALDGLQRLVDQALSCGNYAAGTGHANRLLELEPLSETARRQLMELLARSGQREQALAQYEQCQTVLWEELGILPAAETEALAEAVRAGNVGPGPQAAAPPPHNLPQQPTTFVGRERELQALEEMLAGGDGRLVTILGPGGSGKTRLALAAAERLLPAADSIPCPFPDGAYFVPLAAVDDPAEIPAAIARAMGIRELETEPAALRQQVLRILEDKRLLLVLDNFEQLVEGASWLSEVLQAAGEVRLLVTSRARLKLRAEQLFALGGLPYTEWQSPAEAEGWSSGQLFCQAARQVWPDFWLDDNIGALYEICRLVDGLPLALELAAGWVGLLSLPEIAAEIQRGIDLLAAELADVPERHRSIQALMDSTWQRLSPDEQQILGRLSVFRGGFTRQAAAAVAGADLRRLVGLANQSLIQPQPGRDRYDMHPLLRQYVRGRLDAAGRQAALDAHCAYFCNWIGELTPELWLDMASTVDAVEINLRNVRQAWQQASEQNDFSRLDSAALGLVLFYRYSDRELDITAEFNGMSERLVEMARTSDEMRVLAKLVACATWNEPEDKAALALRGQLVTLEEVAETGIDVRFERALLLRRLAMEAGAQHPAEQRLFLAESCGLFRELDERPALAETLLARSYRERNAQNYQAAINFCLEACGIYKQSGALTQYARCLSELGYCLILSGEIDAGAQRLEEGLATMRATCDSRRLAQFLVGMGHYLRFSGQVNRAIEVCQEATILNAQLFEHGQNILRRNDQLDAGQKTIGLLLDAGRYDEVEAAIDALGDIPEPSQHWIATTIAQFRGILALLKGDLVAARRWFADAERSAWQFGQKHLVRCGQTLIAVAEGHRDEARVSLLDAVNLIVSEDLHLFFVEFVIPTTAVWLAANGQIQRAVELWALANQHPYVCHSQFLADLCGRPVEEVAKQLSPEVRAAAEARGRALDVRVTAAALLEELKAAAGD